MPQPRIDERDEAELDRWVEAKRNRDFGTADNIRKELRDRGIDPDTERPPKSNKRDANAEEMLDEWVDAKRARDFDRADEIRADLRKRGVDPDRERPPNFDAPAPRGADPWAAPPPTRDHWAPAAAWGKGCGSLAPPGPAPWEPAGWDSLGKGGCKGQDPWLEGRLDRWVDAKRAKDYATADAIRDELRSFGADPEVLRPVGGGPPPSGLPPALPPHDGYGRYGGPPHGGFGGWPPHGGYGGGPPHGGYGGGPPPGGKGCGMEWGADPWARGGAELWGKGGADPWGKGGAFGWAPEPDSWAKGKGGGSWDHGSKGGGDRDHDRARSGPDPWVEDQLDRWVDAKRAKDFKTADRLREDLRKNGVDPDKARPPDQKDTPADIDRQLDRWVEAKRAKDFQAADNIRVALRAKGIDPDTERPLSGPPPAKRARDKW